MSVREAWDTTPKAANGYQRAARMADAASYMEREGKLPEAVNACDDGLKHLEGADTREALDLRVALREKKVALLDRIRANGNGKPAAVVVPTPDAAGMRTCGQCGEAKPLDREHFRSGPGPDRFWHRCKECSDPGAPAPDAEGKRECRACHERKPIDTEHFRADGGGKFRRICKECESKANATRQKGKRGTSTRPKKAAVENSTPQPTRVAGADGKSRPAPATGESPQFAPVPTPTTPPAPVEGAERSLRWVLRQAAACDGADVAAAKETARLLAGILAGAGMGAEALFGLAVEELLPAQEGGPR